MLSDVLYRNVKAVFGTPILTKNNSVFLIKIKGL
jgi:hypothetical protein